MKPKQAKGAVLRAARVQVAIPVFRPDGKTVSQFVLVTVSKSEALRALRRARNGSEVPVTEDCMGVCVLGT